MEEIHNLPYASWLEKSLKTLLEADITAICLLTKTADDEVGCGYWNASVTDKVLFAGMVQQDAMIDTLQNNGFLDPEEEED